METQIEQTGENLQELKRISLANPDINLFGFREGDLVAAKYWWAPNLLAICTSKGWSFSPKTETTIPFKKPLHRDIFLRSIHDWLEEKNLYAFKAEYYSDLKSYMWRSLWVGGSSQDITSLFFQADLYKKR